VETSPSELWELHLRIADSGPVAVSCKHGGERVTPGVLQVATPCGAIKLIEQLLATFGPGDQLFITARSPDCSLSMWTTTSKAAGLYWCAAALGQLWRAHDSGVFPTLASRRTA
jgi:hypothetical protein